MKATCTTILVLALVAMARLNAQDIEAKLAGNSAAYGFNIKTNSGITLFRIQGDGNVGINLATPAAKLHVNADAATGEGIRIQGNAAGATNSSFLAFTDNAGTRTGYVGDGSTGNSDIYLHADAGSVSLRTSSGQVLTATPNGRVGIGTTTPVSVLDVNGDIALTMNNSNIHLRGTGVSGNYWSLQPQGWATDQFGIVRYETSGPVAEKSFVINNLGRVGVGTQNPTNKLTVDNRIADSYAGNIYTTGVGSDHSYGLIVSGGTSVSDYALRVRKQDATDVFYVHGNAAVACGVNSSATGNSSFAAGLNATASGAQSVAMGYMASTNGKQGSMVLSDASNSAVTQCVADNQFVSKFAGGYYIYSKYDWSTGVQMAAGTSGWTNICDRNRKENFREIDGESLLAKIRVLPVTEWNYKGADSNIRYMGPMAQDFWQAFHLGGTDSLGINSISIDGVNMAAIKALERRTAELRETTLRLLAKSDEVEQLRAELASVKKQAEQFDRLRAEVAAIREELASKKAPSDSDQASLLRK